MTTLPRRVDGTVRGMVPIAVIGIAILLALGSAAATPGALQDQGISAADLRFDALVHATVVPEPGRLIEDATVVLRDGVIVSVQAGGEVPDGAAVHDLTGHTVLAGFLESHVPIEVPRPAADDPGSHYYHEQVMAQRSAADAARVEAGVRDALRGLGFTTAILAPSDGVLRGSSVAVALTDETPILAEDLYQEVALRRAGFGASDRRTRSPTSEMGAIALLRQTLADAEWYGRCLAIQAEHAGTEPCPPQDALAALVQQREAGVPLLCNCADEKQILRAARVAEEFSHRLVALGTGTEFRRLAAVAASGVPVVLPLDYPEAPAVATEDEFHAASLWDLASWEQAPTNPRRLVQAGITVALTTDKSSDRGQFHASLRKAIEHGLEPDQALAMLTTVPAELFGLGALLGKVEAGKLAHLAVLDGEFLGEDTKVIEVWVNGRRVVTEKPEENGPEGSFTFLAHGLGTEPEQSLEAELSVGRGKVSLTAGEAELAARSVKRDGERWDFLVDTGELGVPGWTSFTALYDEDEFRGRFLRADGGAGSWTAARSEAADPAVAADLTVDESPGTADADSDSATAELVVASGADDPVTPAESKTDAGLETEWTPSPVPEELPLPFGAYGSFATLAAETVVVRGATVWTSGPDGILEDATLCIQDGKVVYVGDDAGAPALSDARPIDGTGLHVTPGLIDCHSHTGIDGGVNETGERVTAEVRIGDVVDADDVQWYRQLAGGLTAANQLHGSANAIGGQNSVVKLRWGVSHPDDMRVQDAPGGIKLALGENPKRVAQNTDIADEYPQTRMGVEALIRSRLQAGAAYDTEWAAYRALSPWQRSRTLPPRRDLELEALAEIVRGERWIHCHSYRQDEILMLCRLAEEMGITIGTFQHVLEGYKVAEAVRDAARGGSTFADWWAYKFEVIDAIPHNATLMHDVGVVVSINSDSNEHARRLNTEAAKAVQYGGMAPADALKLVTLNPAIQLGVEHRMGSLEVGKDADFVLWSGSPLRYASRCLATWVDGVPLYSRERDRELREFAEQERLRIRQKILALGETGEGGGRERDRRSPAGLLGDIWQEWLRSGEDPFAGPGDCGCGVLEWELLWQEGR